MYLDLLCPSCNMILISIFYSFFSKCGSLATRTCLALHIRILLLNVFRLFFETDNNQNVVSSHSESKFCHFWNKNWVLWHAHRGKTNIFGDFCSTVYIPTLLWMHINSCLTCLWEICGKPSRKCTFYTTTNKKKCFDDHLKDGAKRRHNNGMEIIKSENNNKRFMLDEIV